MLPVLEMEYGDFDLIFDEMVAEFGNPADIDSYINEILAQPEAAPSPWFTFDSHPGGVRGMIVDLSGRTDVTAFTKGMALAVREATLLGFDEEPEILEGDPPAFLDEPTDLYAALGDLGETAYTPAIVDGEATVAEVLPVSRKRFPKRKSKP